MSYRPITDSWILCRPKTKFYGGFPSGFLERARVLLLGGMHGSVLFVCAGMVKKYDGTPIGSIPQLGFESQDITLDILDDGRPDIRGDARQLANVERKNDQLLWSGFKNCGYRFTDAGRDHFYSPIPDAVLIDRPYTKDDAEKYFANGANFFPDLNQLLRDSLGLTDGHVGVLDYQMPAGSRYAAKLVAKISVSCGENNRERVFSVWKKQRRAAA